MEEASQGGTSLIPKTPQPELSAGASELRRMLEVVENEILPKTAVQVAAGNKFFGAAVLDSDFNTVVADTNRETECPLYHGEIYTIQQWAAVTEKPPVQGKANRCLYVMGRPSIPKFHAVIPKYECVLSSQPPYF